MVRVIHELQIARSSITVTIGLSITYPKVVIHFWPLSDSTSGGYLVQSTVAILMLCLDTFNIPPDCHMQTSPLLPSFLISNLLPERLSSGYLLAC